MDRFRKNVLIFPGGTEVGQEIFRSLRYCKEVNLFAVSSGVKQHAPFVFEHYREIPPVTDPGCLAALLTVIADWRIDCIYPANPLVIDFLNIHRDTMGCQMILPSPEVLQVTRSKHATYNLLQSVVPVPEIIETIDADTRFPVFLKPDALYGSQGTRIVHSLPEFEALQPMEPGMLVSEFLPGQEFTVDCFSNHAGELLFARPRTRERIRMGTSMHSEPVDGRIQTVLLEHAQRIQQSIPLRGGWFFQMKEDERGELKLLEVEARIAGTMALHRVMGINFPLLSIMDAFALPVRINPLNASVRIDRALTNRYLHDLSYDRVYVDLDDTLIVHDRLNLQLVHFLFQCINQRKRIELISKSLTPDPDRVLEYWRIRQLFDAVHWLREDESKADYIRPGNAIFIDDSFSQRLEIERRCNIPVFDSSMIELLLDDRKG